MTIMPLQTVGQSFQALLERLSFGETVTLSGSDGTPVALLVSLRPAPTQSTTVSDWDAAWDALSHKISRAWRSDKSALDTLIEMRR